MAEEYATYSDEELVKFLQNDDDKAFEEIYDRYWKRLLAMAFLRLKHTGEAEDIVQDIFTSLWLRKSEHTIKCLENWLSSAVKYRIINRINRHLKKEFSFDSLTETSYTDPTIEQRFLDQSLAEHIHRLPEKCRIVFQYSRDHGYSNIEIARQLNISEKTVEKHITTARRQLSLHFRQLLQSLFF